MRMVKKGAVDQSVYFEVLDSSSTTGGRKTGLLYNTASLTAYYTRNGAAAVAITLATLAAANTAHADGGFKEVDATNTPGLYRLDLPDAAVASGAESVVVTIKGATGMVQVSLEIALVDNVASDVFARVGAPVGASISADIAAVKAQTAAIEVDTVDIQSRLPAALVSGRIDSSVGAMAANVITAAAIATGAFTATKFAANALDAVWSATTRLLSAGTNIVLAKGTGVTGFNDIAAGTAMTLTSGERTAIANEVEAQIIDDTDSEKVLQAITDKIAAVNPSLDDLTLGAIASAIRTELAVELARMDATISSRATPAQVATALGTYDAPTKAEMDAAFALVATASGQAAIAAALAIVQGKTDQLTYQGGNVNANIEALNGATLAGTGQSGDKWRPQ